MVFKYPPPIFDLSVTLPRVFFFFLPQGIEEPREPTENYDETQTQAEVEAETEAAQAEEEANTVEGEPPKKKKKRRKRKTKEEKMQTREFKAVNTKATRSLGWGRMRRSGIGMFYADTEKDPCR